MLIKSTEIYIFFNSWTNFLLNNRQQSKALKFNRQLSKLKNNNRQPSKLRPHETLSVLRS